jgi:hypothetical protein
MMSDIGEETLFFSLSYLIGRAYSAAKGDRISVELADSIAFAVLEDWKRNNWRVIEERGGHEVGCARPARSIPAMPIVCSHLAIRAPRPRR